ncbi:MAG: glycerol-3-phosphate dehydrogenase C-terminal domain-containing protein, partial [Antricoccus sp.]
THWIIGTTDTDWTLDKSNPAASRADIDYLLDHINTVLAVPLTHDDIQGVYAGLRPLLSGESDQTSQLSREHAVARPQPGLISIAGGKYTTYRVMAADAIDATREDLGSAVPDSVTELIPLLGAEGYHALKNQIERFSHRHDIAPWRATNLINRYGSMVTELIEMVGEDRSLLEPLQGAEEYLRAEMVYAVTREGALHLDDLLARRTRISIETDDRGVSAAGPTAHLVAKYLGWDETRVNDEIAAYVARVQAERESQALPDDTDANAERTAAPDIRERAVGRALA